MKHSGYSGTPLSKKLGIKPGYKLCALNSPVDYIQSLSPLPEDVLILPGLESNSDIVHAFVHDMETLDQIFPDLKAAITKKGMLWISWPKGTSKVPTDLNRDILRSYVLERGLVDVKIASYNEVYSSLKFVYRLKDR